MIINHTTMILYHICKIKKNRKKGLSGGEVRVCDAYT